MGKLANFMLRTAGLSSSVRYHSPFPALIGTERGGFSRQGGQFFRLLILPLVRFSARDVFLRRREFPLPSFLRRPKPVPVVALYLSLFSEAATTGRGVMPVFAWRESVPQAKGGRLGCMAHNAALGRGRKGREYLPKGACCCSRASLSVSPRDGHGDGPS